MHDKNAARRVLAGHLSNFYAGVIDAAACDRNVRALGAYGADVGDVELEGMTRELANQLAEGHLPTLVLPEIGLTVAPDERTAETIATVAEITEQAALVEAETDPAIPPPETRPATAADPVPADPAAVPQADGDPGVEPTAPADPAAVPQADGDPGVEPTAPAEV